MPISFFFDGWTFDTASGDLRRGDTVARLRPQPAKLLELLLERAGEVVTREEVIARVWPNSVVEFDQSVNYAIRAIRAALGESAGEAGYIETLPRRGYRFRVPVERIDGGAISVERQPVRRRGAIGMTVVIVLIVGVLLTTPMRFGSDDDDVASAPRIAVMVLRHAVGDSLARTRARALAEHLTAELTAGTNAEVIGPTTTAQYGSTRDVVATLARELSVTHVITGSISSDSAEAVFLELIRAEDHAHLWATRTTLVDTTLAATAADTVMALLKGM